MNNYMDIKDYLTQAKLSTPNNNKTKDNKYIKNVKENKLESVKNESKQISNYNRNELIKNKRNNCKSMLKWTTKPISVIKPSGVIKMPQRLSNNVSNNSKMQNSSRVLLVHNVEGSEEKTIIDFINSNVDRGIYKEEAVLNSNSYEPSVADEVEYIPQHESSLEDLNWTTPSLEVDEGTNKYNRNLVNRINPSLLKSAQGLVTTAEFKQRDKEDTFIPNERRWYRTANKIDRINIMSFTPQIIQSTINLGAYKKDWRDEINQQGSSLNPSIIGPNSYTKGARSGRSLTALSLKWAQTKMFANKFNC